MAQSTEAGVSKQPTYGYPCVSDPNDFIPDNESCSPEELAAHRLACQTFGKPEHEPNKGCFQEHDESGRLVKSVLRTSWGIGTNLIATCDGCSEPQFDDDAPLITCHECGGPEFCAVCWPLHEREHEDGRL